LSVQKTLRRRAEQHFEKHGVLPVALWLSEEEVINLVDNDELPHLVDATKPLDARMRGYMLFQTSRGPLRVLVKSKEEIEE
jgi:hypothetical protein